MVRPRVKSYSFDAGKRNFRRDTSRDLCRIDVRPFWGMRNCISMSKEFSPIYYRILGIIERDEFFLSNFSVQTFGV